MDPGKLFESGDFDPIDYINQRFPTEDSLDKLDNEIAFLSSELSTLNTSLMSEIQEHAFLNQKLQKEITNSNQLTKQIVTDVGIIQQKAQKSEELVYDLCKDIKNLDTGKKNLTFTVTALKKFVMMITAVHQLSEHSEQRQYQEVRQLLLALEELQGYFTKYESIEQIREINTYKSELVKLLKAQIKEDLLKVSSNSSLLPPQQLQHACQVAELMGVQYKREIVKTICTAHLQPYEDTFKQQQNAQLENTERRFGWLQRNMKEFDKLYGEIFPRYWGVKCFYVYEFCSITRQQMTILLEEAGENVDVTVLIKSLQSTIKFEDRLQEELEKEYKGELEDYQQMREKGLIDKSQEGVRLERVPRIKRTISDSFEQHMKPYVRKEEEELKQSILKSLGQDQLEKNSQLKVFSSSLFMFNHIKSVIKRSADYSRNQAILEVSNLIRRSLRLYAHQLQAKIQQEFTIRLKDEPYFECYSCFTINTAEYCKDTLEGLWQSIRQHLEEKEEVTLEYEEDMFTDLLNKGIETLLLHLEQKLDNDFSAIPKIQFGPNDSVGDVSSYIGIFKSTINNHVQQIKTHLSDVYFVFYLNKLVLLVTTRFIQNLYKSRRICAMSNQQLQLDLYEIKTCLLDLFSDTTDRAYLNFQQFVNKSILKCENILKLLLMPNDEFINNFTLFLEDGNTNDLEKMQSIKNIRKQDLNHLYKRLFM